MPQMPAAIFINVLHSCLRSYFGAFHLHPCSGYYNDNAQHPHYKGGFQSNCAQTYYYTDK